MKVICVEYNREQVPAIIPIGDNALLRNNQDFFFPEFTDELSCIPQLVVRIDKLGKSIPQRFAGRYYREIGVGIRFYADTLEASLKTDNLPIIMASSFDNSAAISSLKTIDEIPPSFALYINGELCAEYQLSGIQLQIDNLLSKASDFHTIKIGDYLYCGNTERIGNLRINDRLQVRWGDEWLMDFFIR